METRLGRLATTAIAFTIALALTACGGSSTQSLPGGGSPPYQGPSQGAPPVPGTLPPIASGSTEPVTATESAPPPDDGVPSNATVISNIQTMTGWESCTSCAGGSKNAAYNMHQNIADPSLSGASAQFSLFGSTPYSNALWWKQLGGNDAPRNFVYDLYLYVSDGDAPQALEFDVNHSIGNLKFIFGTECDFKGARLWRVWDTAGSRWVATSAPCELLAAKQWHHLVWQFQRTADNRAAFVSVTVNGRTHPINLTFSPQRSSVHEINVAFQMDGNSTQQPYSVWLDKVTLKYW